MINFFASPNMLGYGIHGNNMIKACIKKGIDINLSKVGMVQMDTTFEKYIHIAISNLSKFNANNPSVFIYHAENSNYACGTPLLTFAIFETTKPSSRMIYMLENGPTDIVLTTTHKHKEILTKLISKPVKIVHEGVDKNIFNTKSIKKYLDTQKFTFITVGKKEERKYTNQIIETFLSVMKDKNVAFLAHTFNPHIKFDRYNPLKSFNCWSDINPQDFGFSYNELSNNIIKFSHDNCDVYFTPRDIPVDKMSSLYHSADIGIQCSRGEGWDLPLSEMLACGMPVIASNCLGHSEYLESSPNIQKQLCINPEGSEKAYDGICFHGEQGEWNTYNKKCLAEKILESYNNPQYKKKSDELSLYMHENYSWDNSVESLLDIINEYQKRILT